MLLTSVHCYCYKLFFYKLCFVFIFVAVIGNTGKKKTLHKTLMNSVFNLCLHKTYLLKKYLELKYYFLLVLSVLYNNF